LSRVTHHQQSGGSERGRKEHKPQQQLRAQSQVVVAFKEGYRDPAYSCEVNRSPPIFRAARKAARIRLVLDE
jgi:hypothetical protein